ncbi:hypothetical protein [Luteolibacter luteus]|uniref:Apea-like HEPN domain-containing protein n=1 Tax=Luteolibacter luteus TaxID=2728835 RepID=A0A858RNT4_9BACT|nr:hypothetical protein [Luteolibacter luteus]QJE97989.1 hypothetical protein HHL09_20085 [Luteolibacter luteus]
MTRDPAGDVGPRLLSAAVPVLLSGTQLGNGIKLLLWQYREATRESSVTLGALLQLCALLEGAIGLVLRHKLGLSKSAIDKLPLPSGQVGRPGVAEARFYEASTRLGFSWATEFGPVFQKWKDVRNSLAHGELMKIDRSSGRETLAKYHAVLQAFNAIILRAIDYKGSVSVDGNWYAVKA